MEIVNNYLNLSIINTNIGYNQLTSVYILVYRPVYYLILVTRLLVDS